MTLLNLALWPLKSSYLNYRNACGHQILQSGDWVWGAPTHNVEWLFHNIALPDHVAD